MGDLLPGDLIAFNGIVGGERGLCLVVRIIPYDTGYGLSKTCRVVNVVRQGPRYTDHTVYLDEEDKSWFRLNERDYVEA